MGIEVSDPLEFYLDTASGYIAIRKYRGVSCDLCHSTQDLTYFKDSFLCKQCILNLKGNIDVIPVPVSMVKEPTHKEKGAKPSTSKKLAEQHRRLIRVHPTAKQSEYAEWLGVSQGRISQLKRLL